MASRGWVPYGAVRCCMFGRDSACPGLFRSLGGEAWQAQERSGSASWGLVGHSLASSGMPCCGSLEFRWGLGEKWRGSLRSDLACSGCLMVGCDELRRGQFSSVDGGVG